MPKKMKQLNLDHQLLSYWSSEIFTQGFIYFRNKNSNIKQAEKYREYDFQISIFTERSKV